MEIYDGSYRYNPMYGPCSIVVWTKGRAEAELRPGCLTAQPDMRMKPDERDRTG